MFDDRGEQRVDDLLRVDAFDFARSASDCPIAARYEPLRESHRWRSRRPTGCRRGRPDDDRRPTGPSPRTSVLQRLRDGIDLGLREGAAVEQRLERVLDPRSAFGLAVAGAVVVGEPDCAPAVPVTPMAKPAAPARRLALTPAAARRLFIVSFPFERIEVTMVTQQAPEGNAGKLRTR